MRKYLKTLLENKNELATMAKDIFQESNNKLTFCLQDQNLLQDTNNCIESSTAIGYAVEEFLVSKLVNCSSKNKKAFKIQRYSGATTQDSYDCFYLTNGIKILVNIKAEKIGRSNDAIAAIKQLRKDYCDTDTDLEKSYIILKVKYQITNSNTSKCDSQRCIEIVDVESYSLEEIDMKAQDDGFQQDNRNWKAGSNNYNNGRLKASATFRRLHIMKEEDISYQHTKQVIIDIFTYNENRGTK